MKINKEIESHYLTVIETNNYEIDNLEVRLKTATNHLKRIEDDRLSLKRDVDFEIKKLEDLGSLEGIDKPDFLLTGLQEINAEDDPSLTLTDIYQFLLFEGEIVNKDPANLGLNTNFQKLKNILSNKLFNIQKTTAGQVIKRVYKRLYPVDVGMQTMKDPIEDHIQNLKDKELNLYRKKCDLQQENKELKLDILKLQTQFKNLEKVNANWVTENEFLTGQVKKYSNYEKESRKDKDHLARASYKIKKYQDLVEKRDQTISQLLQRENKVKGDMDMVIKQFNEMMKNSKLLKEEILFKRSQVTQLQKDLR